LGILISRNPDTSEGLEQRLFVRIHRIPAELPHSSKLESRNPVRPRRILAKLPCSSYEEGSRQARRPSSPHSLATLPARLRLATTLRKRVFQVESSKCDVCVEIHRLGGIYRAMGEIDRLGRGGNSPSGGRPAEPHGQPPNEFSFH
jgi:hypothetical protein